MVRLFYSLILYLASPYIFWRLGRRHGWRGVPWGEYLGFAPVSESDGGRVWIHTVSVGEAAAAEGLTRALVADGEKLLLTHTTAAGGEYLRRAHPGAAVAALPVDFPGAVRRFLRRARPRLGVFVEAEYWPNLLHAAKKEGVKLFLANARLGQKNARQYRKLAGLFVPAIAAFDGIAAQTARDAGRLRCFAGRGAGGPAGEIVTAGNLKFDMEFPAPPPAAAGRDLRLSAKPTILLAATRAGEEEKLLAEMSDDFLREFFVILAPRHPQRRGEIAALLRRRGIRFCLRSEGGEPPAADADTVAVADAPQIFVADTMGEMAKWYAAADAAFVGGGLAPPFAGQNPIEALRAGVAVVAAGAAENYRQLVLRAARAGVLFRAKDAGEAVNLLQKIARGEADFSPAAARGFCEKQRGALQINLEMVRRLSKSHKKNRRVENFGEPPAKKSA